MNVIVLAIALDQLRLKGLADLGDDAGQVTDGKFGQNVATVFG
jgi:hypothetical protein